MAAADAHTRSIAEIMMLATTSFPPEIVLIIGRLICEFRITTYAQRAFIRQSPRILAELHTTWTRNTQELWYMNDAERYEDEIDVHVLTDQDDRRRLRQECGMVSRRHTKRAKRLLDILAAGR